MIFDAIPIYAGYAGRPLPCRSPKLCSPAYTPDRAAAPKSGCSMSPMFNGRRRVTMSTLRRAS